jgi:HD-GYP domain-containing protein (c-di-GMP phosphodiesterase class II)
MVNDRPYRKALSKRQALEELQRNSGTQFDPVLVSLFIEKVADNL